jgi:sarcosine oxidase
MAILNHPVYDCIVLGVGSMGSSACYHLAARGQSVLGIEQFDVLHTHGAHSGHTRIIRKAYFEHPDYIPLLQRAYENWAVLESMTGEKIYYPTGLLYAAPAGDPLIEQVKASAKQYAIPLQILSKAECSDRYPPFSIPDGFEIVLEPEAGFLDVGKAITNYAKAAQCNRERK